MQIIRREDFLEILAENGNPPYLYSLDNVNWQTSNIFKNLDAGIYQIYVKSQTNSCTAVATSAVLFIPNAFTPNQDGYNDVWKVSNIEFFSKVKLKIFDKFGTQVFTAEDVLKFNWDGLYNGRLFYLQELIGMLWKLMVIIPERGGFFLKIDKIRKPNQRFGFSH